MKKLISPGVIQIPSSLPRTKAGPDSRGIRICMAELGRSCSLQQGFIIFTDGSAYSYDAPSLDDVVSLCDSFTRGKDFNFRVRRSRGGYVRGFTPPSDYETIYSYPPYPGTTPTACGLGVWGAWNHDSGDGAGNIVSASDGQLDWDLALQPPNASNNAVDSWQTFTNNTGASIHMDMMCSYSQAIVAPSIYQIRIRITFPFSTTLAIDSVTVPTDPTSGTLHTTWDAPSMSAVYVRVQTANNGFFATDSGSMLVTLS